MELPNLKISAPANISDFAKAKGEEFYKLFLHFTSRIQADEITEIKANGEFIRGALIKARKGLATKIALNPDRCSVYILEEVETLSPEEIERLLTNVEKEYPIWLKAIGPLLKGIMNGIGYALIDDMFEVDSKAISQADEKQFKDLLQLVYLVGLTIPEEFAKGSRVETFLESEEQ